MAYPRTDAYSTIVLGYAIHQYGSIDGFLKAYSDMQGMDYNELMKQFMAK